MLPTELNKLAPFHHDIEISPGVWTSDSTRRVRNGEQFFFPSLLAMNGGSLKGKRVLDVGCNCGGFSLRCAQLGADVLGVDSRKEHIVQANALAGAMNLPNARFELLNLEEDEIPEADFDITLLFGIAYHLSNPLGILEKILDVTREQVFVDSHVHYSNDTAQEDSSKWWMLRDTDQGLTDGLSELGPATPEQWLDFIAQNPVPYGRMTDQFKGSPHFMRELAFAQNIHPTWVPDTPTKEGVHAAKPGSLVMVPNRKALIEVLRDNGFENVVDIVPRRFSEPRYLLKYRIGLVGFRD